MTRNGRHTPRRPRIEVVPSPTASPEEAAAIAAAIEQFLRDTAPAPVSTGGPPTSPWLRAGLLESRDLDPTAPTHWGNA